MALRYRPLVVQLARDALARWVFRATGLTPTLDDGKDTPPRPALPYVSLTFPRGRRLTGYRKLIELSETIGTAAVLVIAGEGEPCTVLANTARATLTREVGEDAADFATRLAEELTWWLRGRATATPSGDDVVVAPLAPGLLVRLQAVEGCTVDLGLPGPPSRRVERLHRAGCRVEILGAPAGAAVGAEGDGLDAYTIEAALREGLSDPALRADLRAAYLVPHALPEGEASYASAVSGALRENRLQFDLEFGWTGFYSADPEVIETVELELGLAQDGVEEIAEVVLPLPIPFP